MAANTPQALAAAELLRRRDAEDSLLHFTKFTFPTYRPDPVHDLMASTLDRVLAGEIKRLMIFAPPQHGKSQLVSVHLPAFWLGRRPNDPLIITSYGSSLAERKSREARNLVESQEYRRIFEGVTTAQDSRAVNDWKLAHPHRGGVLAAGVGGPVTGSGALCGIIDDPHKDWKEAQSLTVRNGVWEWWKGTFRTRIWEDGAVILIMCMTGDTPVLMADGTERPLSEIKIGDRVATYDNGKLGTTTVRNHRSNGADAIFKVTTACGRTVHANERHPFLVEEHGQLKWIRLKYLTTAHRIVTLKGKKANGKERRASLKDAGNLSVAADTARRTTPKRYGQMVIVPHRTTLRRVAALASSTDTGSRARNTMLCSLHKMASAPSANNPQARTCAHTGVESCVSTTTTIPTPSEVFCATTAISPWATRRQKQPPLPLLSTSDFTTEAIASIEPAGIEEVFDIEVDCTENFIANGLVSHNTRWHSDDLAGRLLSSQADLWTVLRLPALAETQDERDEANRRVGMPLGQLDPLGRLPGEALAPGRFSREALLELKRDVGSLVWSAEYQGSPTALEGTVFKRDWFRTVGAAPREARRVRYWDKAGTAGGGAFTAGVLLAIDNDNRVYIEDVQRGQWSALERETTIAQTALQDAIKYGDVRWREGGAEYDIWDYGVDIWLEQEPGSSGKDSAESTLRNLIGFNARAETATGSKDVRLEPFRAQCEAKNVYLVQGPWIPAYLDELAEIPNGTYRDQSDATSGAFNKATKTTWLLA